MKNVKAEVKLRIHCVAPLQPNELLPHRTAETERRVEGEKKVHISFRDVDSLCPISLQVLYITYSLDISLKYALAGCLKQAKCDELWTIVLVVPSGVS